MLWLCNVAVLAWGQLCLVYPGVAVFTVLGVTLGKLALGVEGDLSGAVKLNNRKKSWENSGIKQAKSRWVSPFAGDKREACSKR